MPSRFLGDFQNQSKCGHPISYFDQRDCWVDCRGKDMLQISGECFFGWDVKLITASHSVVDWPNDFGNVIFKPIIIHRLAWITSFCILYNCEIGEGAIVAPGSVVCGQKVEPWTLVEGNPAKVIKKYNSTTKKWERV